MTRKRRTFTPEFKREAARLVLDQGYSIAEASTSLGVVDSVLRRWVKQLSEERQGITPPREGHDARAAAHSGARRAVQAAGNGEIHTKKGYRSLDVGRLETYTPTASSVSGCVASSSRSPST